MADLLTAARLASLAAEDDPGLKERVASALERLGKIEEEIAKLVAGDVVDTPLPAEAPPPAVTAAPKTFSVDTRERLADTGDAMADGGFPITSRADLRRAIQSFGRAKDPAAVKRHIKRRARELEAENTLPDSWD